MQFGPVRYLPAPVLPGAGSRRRWPREGDVPTLEACPHLCETDWDVSIASAERSLARTLARLPVR
jgi:hypothetical protein